MGVFICPCKIKEKVGNIGDDKEYDADVLKIDGDFIIEPFERGYYTYECSKPSISISYGSNQDFISCISDLDPYGFSVTLSSCGIDNAVSYKCAEEMLAEFDGHLSEAEVFIYERFGEDYGAFIWRIYKEFIEVLKECIKLQGVVRFH